MAMYQPIYIYLGSALFHTTNDGDYIILCEHNDFVIINFVFSKDFFWGKFLYMSFCTINIFLHS
jgi:hypothetical protein